MVLTHRTGFPNWRKGGWRSGGKLPVRFQPGSQFGYSGEGFWYLQQVVEHVTDEPLDPWSQRVLLKPLKMSHSSCVWRKDYSKFAAAGYNSDSSVKKDRRRFDRTNAAFTLYTTPSHPRRNQRTSSWAAILSWRLPAHPTDAANRAQSLSSNGCVSPVADPSPRVWLRTPR